MNIPPPPPTEPTLPQVRINLKNISSNNQSLQDIVKSCTLATEVISVEPYDGKVHNTKMIIRIDKGANSPVNNRYIERILFYNRLDIAAVLENTNYDAGGETSLDTTIIQLNNLGFDFTTDDLELDGNRVKAKQLSLGYYNKVVTGCGLSNVSWQPFAKPLVIDQEKNYVLSYLLDVAGVVTTGRAILNPAAMTTNNSTDVALYLFDSSSIGGVITTDNIDKYFIFTPTIDSNPAQADMFNITGIDENTPRGNQVGFSPKSINLRLLPMLDPLLNINDDVTLHPANYIDYVAHEFGVNGITFHSCGEFMFA